MQSLPTVRRSDRSEDLTRRAADALRELIASGGLSPGEQIRQEEVAARVGVSRSPLREAMRTLEQEGLLLHEPHRGYFVARLGRDELTQVYRMRQLLERELLRSLAPPPDATLAALRALNAEIAQAMRRGAVAQMLRANRAFHFTLFDLSPLTLVRREVQRLWRLSEPYQATYLWHPATRERIVAEHDAIVDALAAGDRRALARLLDAHRESARSDVLTLLAARDPA